jgi:hypothetical protein
VLAASGGQAYGRDALVVDVEREHPRVVGEEVDLPVEADRVAAGLGVVELRLRQHRSIPLLVGGGAGYGTESVDQ